MNIKKLVFALSLVCYIIYLLSINGIIASLHSDNPLEKINFNELKSTQEGKYDIKIEYVEFYDVFNTTGWAYCVTDSPEDGKPVSIVFRGENSSYASKAITQHTLEAGQVFGYNSDRTFRFQHTTSLIELPNGLYDLYLYCEENENDTMLVNLGKRFEKKYAQFNEIGNVPFEKDLELEYTDRVLGGIATTKVNDGENFSGYGWICLDGYDATYQRVLMRIYREDSTYETYLIDTVDRRDVVDHFEEYKYLYSGFEYEIPSEPYAGETVQLEIIVEQNGHYYSNGERSELNVYKKE